MPQAVTLRDRTAVARPRLVRDVIVLGHSTILVRRAVERGCYCVEKPNDDALASLMSLAYEKRISLDDPMVRAVLRAADVLLKSPERVDSLFAHLPEPSAAGITRLPQAERLLKAGTRPADLEGALRRDRLGLPPTPAYADRLILCDKGVVLGKGTVIAALEDSVGVGLVLKGREERILALLSVASGQSINADVLTKFEAVSRALKEGNVSLVAIHLAHVGLPPLAHVGLAKALSLAAAELDRGVGPFDLLKGLDLLPRGIRYADWSPVLRKEGGGNPNHVPAGCPEGGQFCSADQADGGDGSIPIPDLPKPPAPYASWDAYYARNPEVPDYKSQVVDQSDFRDFNRAADALPGQTPTQSFVYREVFAAEGGSEPADNGVVAGITQAALNNAIKAKVDGIDRNSTLDDLTTEQMASIYRHEFDRSLGLAGGSSALDRVGDPGAAAALGDTLFWFGDTGGAAVVRQAIADTSGSPVEGKDRLGPVAFDRYSQLAQDPATRQTLLDRLAVYRQDKAKLLDQDDKARIEHFRFRRQRKSG